MVKKIFTIRDLEKIKEAKRLQLISDASRANFLENLNQFFFPIFSQLFSELTNFFFFNNKLKLLEKRIKTLENFNILLTDQIQLLIKLIFLIGITISFFKIGIYFKETKFNKEKYKKNEKLIF